MGRFKKWLIDNGFLRKMSLAVNCSKSPHIRLIQVRIRFILRFVREGC